jgi:hypothetical protein
MWTAGFATAENGRPYVVAPHVNFGPGLLRLA